MSYQELEGKVKERERRFCESWSVRSPLNWRNAWGAARSCWLSRSGADFLDMKPKRASQSNGLGQHLGKLHKSHYRTLLASETCPPALTKLIDSTMGPLT